MAEAPTGEFQLTQLERVISGPGRVDHLGFELERRGLTHALIVTGSTLSQSRILDRIKNGLGLRLAGVFTGVRQHVPAKSVSDLATQIQALGADALISFGGGSPIDTAKAAAFQLLKDGGPGITHIAIPTTLSAGEFTPTAGVTDEATRVKHGLSDPRLSPQSVIQDPFVTLETPASLWGSTAIRALDHAIESAYSLRHHPFSDALATKAIALLVEHLLPSIRKEGTEQLAHRGYCQMASWLSIFGATNTRFGLSHALGHQIGPRWNVPHGVTSCITLPHVMRYMAQVAPERFGPIAEGYGIKVNQMYPRPSALESADRTAGFIARLGVSTRLRDVNVPESELASIAPLVAQEMERMQVLERPVQREDIVNILRSAW